MAFRGRHHFTKDLHQQSVIRYELSCSFIGFMYHPSDKVNKGFSNILEATPIEGEDFCSTHNISYTIMYVMMRNKLPSCGQRLLQTIHPYMLKFRGKFQLTLQWSILSYRPKYAFDYCRLWKPFKFTDFTHNSTRRVFSNLLVNDNDGHRANCWKMCAPTSHTVNIKSKSPQNLLNKDRGDYE